MLKLPNFGRLFNSSKLPPSESKTKSPEHSAQIEDWATIAGAADAYRLTFANVKAKAAPADFPWYPYDSLANFGVIGSILKDGTHSLHSLAGDEPILDIGCADGATSFFLAARGYQVQAVDYPPTNFNKLRGLQTLQDFLGASIEIHALDLDSQFTLPKQQYGLTLFLGLLYHLKNPFFALEQLAKSSRYCLLSTRVAKFAADRTTSIENIPVAYLVSPIETNNDNTNYWIFSRAGLLRILERTRWEVCAYTQIGNTASSDPASPEGDERAFCLLRSSILAKK